MAYKKFNHLIIAFLILNLIHGAVIYEEDHKIAVCRPELLAEINSIKTTWTAEVSTRFADATHADVKRMLGTILPGESEYIEPELERTKFLYTRSNIPDSFDVRKAWPECSSVIGRVRDQSSCGSCWAFASTEAINDRYCIKTGNTQALLSPEDTISCCHGLQCAFSMGCNGGQPSGAWNWFVKTGVSTGGDFSDKGKGTSCKPYSFESCAHHVSPPPGYVGCDTLPDYSTPKCINTCTESTYEVSYSKDKMKAISSYSVKGVENIQKELMERGTVSVAMEVYEDFELYSTGIYQHVTGKFLGGHAIKMIGWGEEEGIPYWICVNSWNDLWGEKGTFRILRGSNECGIEGAVVAGEV